MHEDRPESDQRWKFLLAPFPPGYASNSVDGTREIRKALQHHDPSPNPGASLRADGVFIPYLSPYGADISLLVFGGILGFPLATVNIHNPLPTAQKSLNLSFSTGVQIFPLECIESLTPFRWQLTTVPGHDPKGQLQKIFSLLEGENFYSAVI